MSSDQREEFLKNHWSPFPAAPRLVEREGARTLRVQEVSAQTQTVTLSSGLKVPSEKWANVLLGGDIVQVRDEKIEKLLVPSKQVQPKHWLDVDAQKRWADYLRFVREYFWGNGFDETPTPSLVASPGVEEYLHGFYTDFEFGSETARFALPTSPEFGLKKYLSAGLAKIFEIKTCFRNLESGEQHAPEFTMIEWYRSFATFEDLMDDTEKLVAEVAARFEVEVAKVHRLSVNEAFERAAGASIATDISRDELMKIASANEVSVQSDDSWNDVFFKIVLERIEPYLAELGPVILHSYPKEQAALARLNEQGWAQRFEFYWNGFEIANAFDELNDPQEQRERFTETNRKRRELGFEEMPLDEDFLNALDYGMPPSAGIALGLERLYMALFEIRDIREVRSFTRPEDLC